jgi:hypothetical protein
LVGASSARAQEAEPPPIEAPPPSDGPRPPQPPEDAPAVCTQRSEPCPPCEQPKPPPEPVAAPRRGLLLLGYVGVNTFPEKGVLSNANLGLSLSVGPGLRLGGLLGVYLPRRISLNGELTVDIINSDDPHAFWKTGGTRTALAFSPLVHLPASQRGAVEIALGPKLGYRWTSISSITSEVMKARGYVAGVNAGVFARGGVVMLGGLTSFEMSETSTACVQQADLPTDCSADLTGSSSEKVFSVSGAVLY